jgi:small subunit ribosomal protein S1
MGISDGSTRDIAIIARVNKPVRFIIDEIKETPKGKLAILSRKKVQNDFIDNRLSLLAPGDIIDARVTHLESFGVFCDIGCGINALLPIDNISVSRIPHPNVRFSGGDNIKAVIKSVDDYGRVTLTHKELLGTWEENAKGFNTGETVSGIVRSIESYGIFVELTPNLSGLAEYTPNVYEGQQASVFIKSIIPEKMKIKLIIIDSFDNLHNNKYRYFYNNSHINEFIYSPPESIKQINTYF